MPDGGSNNDNEPAERRWLCKACGEFKGRDSFYWKAARPTVRQNSRCKPCVRIQHREHYKKHAARVYRTTRIWIANNPDRKRAHGAAYYRRTRAKLNRTIERNIVAIRQRCKKYGWPLDIDVDFILSLYAKQDGKCALTGRTLVWGVGRNRDSLSIDRIRPELGYTRGNLRLVTFHANMARNNFTDSELIELAVGIINTLGGVEAYAA